MVTKKWLLTVNDSLARALLVEAIDRHSNNMPELIRAILGEYFKEHPVPIDRLLEVRP